MNKLFKENSNFLLKPILFALIVVIVAVLLAVIGFGQISNLITKTEEAKQTETKLAQKVNALESVSEIITGDTTFLDVVLPSKSATLYGVSQVKNQALLFGVTVTNIKTGTSVPEKGGVDRISISFEAEGTDQSIYDYLGSFSKILPLINIEKVKMAKSASSARAEISMNVYSADLPKVIPSISTPANTLTNDEVKLLNELATFTLPVFIEPTPANTSSKADPFN